MRVLKPHCSVSYHEMLLELIEPFSYKVKGGYFGHNPPFTDLTLTEAAFLLLITTFVAARNAYINGGEAQKGDYLLAKAALMEGLDTLAKATDKVANGNTDTIILAGFDPTKDGTSEGVKPGQAIVTVKRGITLELITSCPVVLHAKHYACIMSEGAPLPDWITLTADGKLLIEPPQDNPTPPTPPVPPVKVFGIRIDLTDQREKHFTGLTAGVTYYFYYFAINATGVGPMSDGVSLVAY